MITGPELGAMKESARMPIAANPVHKIDPEFPIRHRGKCPKCGSPNLHHSFTASEFLRELQDPETAVLCRVCPDVWVLPIWDEVAPATRPIEAEFRNMTTMEVMNHLGERYWDEMMKAGIDFSALPSPFPPDRSEP